MTATVRLFAVATLVAISGAIVGQPDPVAATPSTGINLACCSASVMIQNLTSGVERSIAPIAPGDIVEVRVVLWVQVIGETAPETWVYLHPCGSVPDRTRPAVSYTRPGRAEIGAPLGETGRGFVVIPADADCMTAFGPASSVSFTVTGSEGQPDGLNYVAASDPTSILQPELSSGRATLRVVDDLAPDDPVAVVMRTRLRADDLDAGTSVRVRPCPITGQLGFSASLYAYQSVDATTSIVPLDSAGNVCFESSGAPPAELTVEPLGYLSETAAPSPDGLPTVGFATERMPGFTALTPRRVFDTRDSGVPVLGGAVYRYTFDDLPAEATAVAVNLTATGTTAPGYVSAYPCDGAPPTVSNVNFLGPDETVPNFVIVALSAEREVCFFVLATTHLIVDLSGYFTSGAGDGYRPADPRRLFDTRDDEPIAAGGVRELQLQVDAAVTAIVMNVTVTQPAGVGYVSVYPCSDGRPNVSNLNYRRGETRPNLVTVRIPADGRICFYTLAASHLLADVTGFYAVDSDVGYLAFDPYRLFDSRDTGMPFSEQMVHSKYVGAADIVALAWNLTATQPEGPGFVRTFPCGGPAPNTSVLNFVAGQTVANFAIVQPGADDRLCFTTLRTTHLIADESGVFTLPLVVEVPYAV